VIKQIKNWQTRTRIKVFVFAQIPVLILAGIVLWGWFRGLSDAPTMMTAIMGPDGIWGIGTALSVALEKALAGKSFKKSEEV
jgi:hypothetical protein